MSLLQGIDEKLHLRDDSQDEAHLASLFQPMHHLAQLLAILLIFFFVIRPYAFDIRSTA